MKGKIIFLTCFLLISYLVKAENKQVIKISTNDIDLIYKVGDNGRLYQSYLGKKLHHPSDLAYLPQEAEAYLTHGMEDYFEPAIHVVHNDGNPSLLLKYISHTENSISPEISETVITLQDDKYPVTVKLHYIAYTKENIIKTFTEISHQEKKPIELQKYASSMLHLNHSQYFLTEFSGDWANEVNMKEQPLEFGKKILDSKLGTRANMLCSPFFQLSLDQKAEENQGEILVGTLGWTGNFRFTFEIDNKNKLRIILISTSLQKLLTKYIKKSGIKTGSIFVTKSGKPLDRSNIWKAMKTLCKHAGVSPEKVYPHALRHLFARTFYSINKDIIRLADLLGHSSINTTRVYTMESGYQHISQLEQLQKILTA